MEIHRPPRIVEEPNYPEGMIEAAALGTTSFLSPSLLSLIGIEFKVRNHASTGWAIRVPKKDNGKIMAH